MQEAQREPAHQKEKADYYKINYNRCYGRADDCMQDKQSRDYIHYEPKEDDRVQRS